MNLLSLAIRCISLCYRSDIHQKILAFLDNSHVVAAWAHLLLSTSKKKLPKNTTAAIVYISGVWLTGIFTFERLSHLLAYFL